MIAPERSTGRSSAVTEGLAWPDGSPAALRDAASGLGRGAELLSTSAQGVAAATGKTGDWTGAAAEAFRRTVQTERRGLARAHTAVADAAQGLARLATRLEDAQTEIAKLAEQVREAREAAAQAGTVAERVAGQAEAASRAAQQAPEHHDSVAKHAAKSADEHLHAANSRASAASSHFAEVLSRAQTRATELVADIRRLDGVTAAVVRDAVAAIPAAGRVRHGVGTAAPGPTPAQRFNARFFAGLGAAEWRKLAYHEAGIDPDLWDPEKGLRANYDTVLKVYRQYGNLFKQDNDLQWAGMANLVGPMFLGGWEDLVVAKEMASPADRAKALRRMTGLPDVPGPLDEIAVGSMGGAGAAGLAALGAEELGWTERRMLKMQKNIYDDMAWQHLAYTRGGTATMQGLGRSQQLTRTQVQTWEKIGSGDPSRIDAGNGELLRREQEQIIQRDYRAIRTHSGPAGEAMTTAMTVVAQNPVPGGHDYMDVESHKVTLSPTPSLPVVGDPVPWDNVSIPVPNGNLADFSDRWEWIEGDMLPAYQAQLDVPGAVQSQIDVPVDSRASQYRLVPLPY